jgi:hypothetical protein
MQWPKRVSKRKMDFLPSQSKLRTKTEVLCNSPNDPVGVQRKSLRAVV